MKGKRIHTTRLNYYSRIALVKTNSSTSFYVREKKNLQQICRIVDRTYIYIY